MDEQDETPSAEPQADGEEYVDPTALEPEQVPWRPVTPEPLSQQPKNLRSTTQRLASRLNDDRTPEQVRHALSKRNAQQKKRSWIRGLVILAISVAVFAAMGLFQDTVQGVALLVGVIFIHEMGHLVAMKLFGYRDVQMFFIPLFGAAVSGDESMPSGTRRAIVSLMGPVPGILIGIAVAIIYFRVRAPFLLELAWMFLILNVFNLFPFHPLDGGRFFEHVLFSRHPKLEVVFKFLASIALLVIAVAMEAFFLAFFVVVLILNLANGYRCAVVARHLKGKLPPPISTDIHAIPDVHLEHIVAGLNDKLSQKNRQIDRFVAYVEVVWQRIAERPPKAGATAALLIAYAVVLLLGIIAPIAVQVGRMVAEKATTIETDILDGKPILYERERLDGKVIREVPLTPDGLLNGTETVWYVGLGTKKEEYVWVKGFPHGEGRTFDLNGNVTRIVHFQQGTVREVRQRKEGEMVPVPPEQWVICGIRDITTPQTSRVWLSQQLTRPNSDGIPATTPSEDDQNPEPSEPEHNEQSLVVPWSGE